MLVGYGGPEDEGEQGGTAPAQEPAKETASEDYAVVRVSGTSSITTLKFLLAPGAPVAGAGPHSHRTARAYRHPVRKRRSSMTPATCRAYSPNIIEVVLFSTSTCSWCRRAKRCFRESRVPFKEIGENVSIYKGTPLGDRQSTLGGS